MKTDDALLLKDLVEVRNKMGKIPTQSDYNTHGIFAINTFLQRKPWSQWTQQAFGENNAKEGGSARKISDDNLLDNLRNLHKLLNRSPSTIDLKQGLYSVNAYKRAFGSVGAALVAAGIRPNQARGFDENKILQDLQNLKNILGRTPTIKDYNEYSLINWSTPTFTAHFGSWSKALIKAGITPETSRKVDQDDIRLALLVWYEENNKSDICLEYWQIRKARARREFPYSCNTISAKFHPLSWEEIMHECGFPNYITRNYYITGRRRGNHTGLDSKEYLSSLEKEIGDFLFELKNSNKIKDYEYEAKVCTGKSWTCDFKVIFSNDSVLWLEADGLRNNRYNPYTSGANEKIKFYTDNNMNFKIISYSAPNIRKEVEKVIEKQFIVGG